MGVQGCAIPKSDSMAHIPLNCVGKLSLEGLEIDSSWKSSKPSPASLFQSDDDAHSRTSESSESSPSHLTDASQAALPNSWRSVAFGIAGTASYRLVFLNSHKSSHFNFVSPWHDIPLHGNDGLLNCICKTPAGTWLRFEPARDEDLNPFCISKLKNGVRNSPNFSENCPWNLGMFPQTWADPEQLEEEFDGISYDDSPLEVIDIGGFTPRITGEVYPVKPLGAFALIDGSTRKMAWKIVAIANDDPMAEMLSGVKDMEQRLPGCLELVREWLRGCTAFGKEPNSESYFLPDDRPSDLHTAIRAVAETHAAWQLLAEEMDKHSTGKSQPSALSLTLTPNPNSPERSYLRKALSEGDGALLSLELGTTSMDTLGEELEGHWKRRYNICTSESTESVPVSGGKGVSSAIYNRAWESLGEDGSKDGKRTVPVQNNDGKKRWGKSRSRGKSMGSVDFGQPEKKLSSDVFGFLRNRSREVNSSQAKEGVKVVKESQESSKLKKSWGFRRAKSESVAREGANGKLFGKKVGELKRTDSESVMVRSDSKTAPEMRKSLSLGKNEGSKIQEFEKTVGGNQGNCGKVDGFLKVKVKNLNDKIPEVEEKKILSDNEEKLEVDKKCTPEKQKVSETLEKAAKDPTPKPEKTPEKKLEKLEEIPEGSQKAKALVPENKSKSTDLVDVPVNKIPKKEEPKAKSNVTLLGETETSEQDLYPSISLPPKFPHTRPEIDLYSPQKSPKKSPRKKQVPKKYKTVSPEELISGTCRKDDDFVSLQPSCNNEVKVLPEFADEFEVDIPVAPPLNFEGAMSNQIAVGLVVQSKRISTMKKKRVTWSEVVEVLIYVPDSYYGY